MDNHGAASQQIITPHALFFSYVQQQKWKRKKAEKNG